MKTAPHWWGPIDGTLHRFETLVDDAGEVLIRTDGAATCGWVPPGELMEAPESIPDWRLCARCLQLEGPPHG